jgi:hypothetical protein
MRSDFLASVGVVDEAGPAETIPRLAEINAELAGAFRYFEMVYVVSESSRSALQAMAGEISRLPNLRIILTCEGTRFYRQRSIAASEMIGDVVALLDPGDWAKSDLPRRIGEANDGKEILIGWRPANGASRLGYRLLSLLSRNVILAQASRTILLPRERLNAILARKNASLDLRFEPRAAHSRYRRFNVDRPATIRGGLSQRNELLIEILLSGAQRYLKAYAAVGFLVSFVSILYAVYAIAVMLLRDHVQEGWFSTAMAQSGSTAFIAGGMSILATALIVILEHISGGDDQMIVDEIANITFFDKATDRNVELSETPVGFAPLNAEVHGH